MDSLECPQSLGVVLREVIGVGSVQGWYVRNVSRCLRFVGGAREELPEQHRRRVNPYPHPLTLHP